MPGSCPWSGLGLGTGGRARAPAPSGDERALQNNRTFMSVRSHASAVRNLS